MLRRVVFGLALILSCSSFVPQPLVAGEQAKKVLLIGQTRDHPPGAHQYMAGLRVLAKCLEDVPNLEIKIVKADEPWDGGHKLLDGVDGVVLSLGQGGRWIQKDERRFAAIQQLAARKTGIVAIHWAIGAKDGRYIAPYRKIIGGIHGGADRKFVISKNELIVSGPQHPIMRAVQGLSIKDEWYYRLKFADKGVTQLIDAKIDGQNQTVGWAFIREGGGRSFGFSGMHYHANWKHEPLRRMVAQSVLWTVGLPIPHKGLAVDVPDEVYELPPDE